MAQASPCFRMERKCSSAAAGTGAALGLAWVPAAARGTGVRGLLPRWLVQTLVLPQRVASGTGEARASPNSGGRTSSAVLGL